MVALRGPLSVGFPRQEYWSGLPFPTPRDLPDLGMEATSPVFSRQIFFTTELPGKPILLSVQHQMNELATLANT